MNMKTESLGLLLVRTLIASALLLLVPAAAQERTLLVKWKDGYVAASGEIRPAVRSREAWYVKPE